MNPGPVPQPNGIADKFVVILKRLALLRRPDRITEANPAGLQKSRDPFLRKYFVTVNWA
jgi:hypothetical protein